MWTPRRTVVHARDAHSKCTTRTPQVYGRIRNRTGTYPVQCNVLSHKFGHLPLNNLNVALEPRHNPRRSLELTDFYQLLLHSNNDLEHPPGDYPVLRQQILSTAWT